MKRIFNNMAVSATILFTLLSCSNIEAWKETEVILPNRVHYSIETAELVEKSEGVSKINDALLRYDISFYDDNSMDRGSVSLIAARNAESFNGTYTLSSKKEAGALIEGKLINDSGESIQVTESVEIAQNALNSLSLSVNGSEAISFAKGSGVPSHQRKANTDCCAKYLINHSVKYAEQTYVHTLSIGAKGITCTEGQYYDTYSGVGDYLILKFASSSEALSEGTFPAAAMESAAPGNLIAGKLIDSGYGFSYLDGSQFYTLKEGESAPTAALAISGGEINIALANAEKELYNVSGTLILEDESVFTISYTGRLTPEPAPARDWNVYFDYATDVYKMDWTTWQAEIVPGIKQHNITILNPRDEVMAIFTPILDEKAESLNGEFKVAENAAEALLMGNGYDATQWGGSIGGSYIINDGDTWLINAGSTITISSEADGALLFKGIGVSVTINGVISTKDIEIKAYTKDYTK